MIYRGKYVTSDLLQCIAVEDYFITIYIVFIVRAVIRQCRLLYLIRNFKFLFVTSTGCITHGDTFKIKYVK